MEPPENQIKQLKHFADREVIFVAEHAEFFEDNQDDLFRRVSRLVVPDSGDEGLGLEFVRELSVTVNRSDSDNPVGDSATNPYVSFLVTRLPGMPETVDGGDVQSNHKNDLGVLRKINELQDRLRSKGKGAADGGVTVVGFTPNWLMSTSQAHITSGGPGAEPVPPDAEINTTQTVPPEKPEEKLYSFKLGDAIFAQTPQASAQSPSEEGVYADAPVHVVILDSAPGFEAFQKASKFLSKNHLLSGLCGTTTTLIPPQKDMPKYVSENGKLSLYDPVPSLIAQLDLNDHEVHKNYDHDYKMPDHGLFIAGIVHDLAPEANIHLVRVLNDYGVGTLNTLAKGLDAIRKNADLTNSKRVIVNCSLTINLLIDEDGKIVLPMGGQEESDLLLGIAFDILNVLRWYRNVIGISNEGGLVIAAAGNDSAGDVQKRKNARCPAAYPRVIGVGTSETYSNKPDMPENEGALTFGGVVKAGGKTDAKQGIAGLYISDFPNAASNANTDGWARWAGTSFAAGVLSGVVAEVCIREGGTPSKAWKDMQKRLGGNSGQVLQIPVTQ